MRVLIVGGGGLGTVLAGCLARSGAEVWLLVKPSQASAFDSASVRVTGSVAFEAPVRVVADVAGLDRIDYTVLCVKGRDSKDVLDALKSLRTDAVFSVQNGVLKDDLLVRSFGRARVLGAVSAVAASLVRPGVAVNPFAGATLIGELSGSVSSRGERIAAALSAGGLPARCVPDILTREWYKLAAFLRTALVCSLACCDIATAALDPDLGPVCANVALDVGLVAAAEGLPIWRFPPSCDELGTADPDSSRSEAQTWSNAEVLAGLRHAGQRLRDAGAVVYPSMAQDTMADRPTELEFTAGDVLARAGKASLEVPALETCVRLLRAGERQRMPA